MAEEQDPLLAELNGALAKTGGPHEIDRPQEQPDSLSKQLETTPTKLPVAPRSAQLDKTHSKAKGGHGYRVVLEGEYYAKSAETKGHVIKRYRLPFNLPALTNAKGEAALGIIVGMSRPGGGLLKAALKKMDPMAETFRTHTIVETKPLDGAPEPTSIQYMNFEALKQYAAEQNLPLDLDDYWDVNDLREDIIDLRTNAADGGIGSKKSVIDRIKERHADRKEEHELLQMNEGLEKEFAEQGAK